MKTSSNGRQGRRTVKLTQEEVDRLEFDRAWAALQAWGDELMAREPEHAQVMEIRSYDQEAELLVELAELGIDTNDC